MRKAHEREGFLRESSAHVLMSQSTLVNMENRNGSHESTSFGTTHRGVTNTRDYMWPG